MPISRFEQVQRATNLGFSRFAMSLPILLRIALLILFVWYEVELYCNATGVGAQSFLIVMGVLSLLVFISVMFFSYQQYLKPNNALPLSTALPLWPFILINLLMILLVAVLGKWDRDRGSHEVTTGLLGFTSYWVQKIGNLLTGRR